jgi:hypothetical protein
MSGLASIVPYDFMFQLTWEESQELPLPGWAPPEIAGLASRSQTVTLKRGQNIKYLGFAVKESKGRYRTKSKKP